MRRWRLFLAVLALGWVLVGDPCWYQRRIRGTWLATLRYDAADVVVVAAAVAVVEGEDDDLAAILLQVGGAGHCAGPAMVDEHSDFVWTTTAAPLLDVPDPVEVARAFAGDCAAKQMHILHSCCTPVGQTLFE